MSDMLKPSPALPDIPKGCEMARGWCVAVEIGGVPVLTLHEEGYSGLRDIDPWESTIKGCAKHLLAFIGAEASDPAAGAQKPNGLNPASDLTGFGKIAGTLLRESGSVEWPALADEMTPISAPQGERALFVRWMKREHPGVSLARHGRPAQDQFIVPAVQEAWQGWQGRASIAADVPTGWQLVPIEPTQAMCQAAQEKLREWPKFPFRVVPAYKAMLAATPQEPSEALDAAPIQAQAAELIDSLLKAAQMDGILRQIRMVPIARDKLLWFIKGAAAGFAMCEDCDGTGTTGEAHPGSEFQPPELERCPSCGGSGRWKLNAAALAATPQEP